MFISKTPLRVSWFGGGVDLPEFDGLEENLVIGGTIDKYIWNFVSDNGAGPFRHKVNYAQVEEVDDFDDIRHPLYREALKHFGKTFDRNVWASTHCDVAYGSGLGGSSAFLVGLLNSLSAYFDGAEKSLNSRAVADLAIHIERVLLQEKGGRQDQYHAAFGGFRAYKFHDGICTVGPNQTSQPLVRKISQMMFLLQLEPRNSSHAHKKRAVNVEAKHYASDQNAISKKALQVLCGNGSDSDFRRFTDLVAQSSSLKVDFSGKGAEPPELATLKDIGISCAKVCGAGGGGHIAFIADNNHVQTVEEVFGRHRISKVAYVPDGSSMLMQDQR